MRVENFITEKEKVRIFIPKNDVKIQADKKIVLGKRVNFRNDRVVVGIVMSKNLVAIKRKFEKVENSLEVSKEKKITQNEVVNSFVEVVRNWNSILMNCNFLVFEDVENVVRLVEIDLNRL